LCTLRSVYGIWVFIDRFAYVTKKVVGVFVRFRAPLRFTDDGHRPWQPDPGWSGTGVDRPRLLH
jgi:hypothetical protein